MKLLDCTFAYKIPQYNVRVTTFAPRKSLAFEWLILEASLTANAHSEYADMSFEDLFAKVFKLSESETFLRMCLSNLIEYKAVECAHFSDEISFSVLKMSDVRITPTGIEMHQKGMLPSKSSENLFQVFKNSVDKDFFLMETNRMVYRGEPSNGEILCDAKGKIEMPTVPQIKDFLLEKQKEKQKKNPFDWLKKETELGEIKISEDDDVRYEKVRNALLIDTDLQCSFEKPELCRGNEIEALFASLPDVPKEFSDLPEFEFESIDESVNKMFMYEKFLENMKNCIHSSLESGESFVVDFTKDNQNVIKESTRSLIERKAKSHEMVIIFQNAPKFNYIAASKSSPVHKIEVPYAINDTDILFDSKKKRFHAGQITIKSERLSKEIAIGFIEENEDFSIEQIAEQIIAQYADENKDLQKLDKFLRGKKSEDKQKKKDALKTDSQENKNVEAKEKQVEEKTSQKFGKVYVFDTNVFMEKLDVLQKILPALKNTKVILPTGILEELDRQKQKKREKAQPAIVYINHITDGDEKLDFIEYANSDSSKLPKELANGSMDNLILSIAISKAEDKTKKVFVITDDKNFRNKAKSQNLGCKNAKELLNDYNQTNHIK